ncbi:hypothetical protein [uncultured Fluviicola sp.]|jgi:hypothetical protein|uniref:hypothetical protein n=1 Tax=uncultured Fluviicola sp. TaxID=463303 RepID=UPI0025ECBF44|nr:hypothetical protein [uncultured Fluviicola sp.]
MDIQAFKENLGISELPAALEKLILFQEEQSDFECYSQGFGILIDDKSGIKSWSEEEAFLARLYPFAQANGSGSVYAFWNDGSAKEPEDLPIVVFGDEGGVHVVANNVLVLMQMLSFDSEISVDFDEAYFYKDEDDYEESEDHQTYKNWLKKEFNLDPVEDPDTLIQKAQENYQEYFEQWFKQYCAD